MQRIITICFLLVGQLLYAQFPATYDLRTLGYVTSVKNQGNNCGSCWAFASCAAIESAWLKQGGNTVDLSEDHLIDCHGFDEAPCAGGSFYMTQALLSRHEGVLDEATDPYTPSTQNCMYMAPFPPTATDFVEEFRLLPPVKNDIKNALMTYGAVASSMYFTMSNYNSTTYKYYDSVIDASDLPNAHGVTIVGWNDTMSFPGATNPGGWIIKDSYGTSWANNGYFYCSYEDAGILSENAVFPTRELVGTKNDHVYAYDKYGWIDNYGYNTNTGYALVKYTLQPSGGNFSPQKVLRIGTYAVEDNTTITLEVYRNKQGNTLSNLLGTYNITCNYKGFYTVPVNFGVDSLNKDYYIKASYSAPSGVLLPIPIEKNEANHSSGFIASTNACWVSATGSSWTQVGQNTSFNFDACIKMYTEDASFTAVAQPQSSQLQVYPNPTSRLLYLEAREQEIKQVRVLDMLGRNCLHILNTAQQIDISTLPQGNYTLWIQLQNGQLHQQRIIRE